MAYVQYRGGPAGFLTTVDALMLGSADFRGNRQYITTGNVRANDRISLFLMDYAHRQRLKIFGHLRIIDARRRSGAGEEANRDRLPRSRGTPPSSSRSFKGTCSVIVQGPQCWKVHNAYLAQLTVPEISSN